MVIPAVFSVTFEVRRYSAVFSGTRRVSARFKHLIKPVMKSLSSPELSQILASRPSCLTFVSATPPSSPPPSAPFHLGCSWKTPPPSFLYLLFFELNLPIKARESLRGRPASVGSVLPPPRSCPRPPSPHTHTLLSPQDGVIKMQSTLEETLPSCS